MHVVINAQLLSNQNSYRAAGVSNYSRHLLGALGQAAAGSSTKLTALINIADFPESFSGSGATAGIERIHSPGVLQHPLVRIAWEQTILPGRLQQLQADVVHGLVNVLPLRTGVPGVVTVHDLSFVHTPEKLPAAKRWYLARLCKASVDKATQVIAVSQQTADDLIYHFGTSSGKITVVHNGVGPEFTPATLDQPNFPMVSFQPANFRQAKGLPEHFALYVGTLEPRKNLELLIRAFACWQAQRPAAQVPYTLVLAGATGWFYGEIFQLVQKLGLENKVYFPGFVPEAELPDWYRAADFFIYPSLFEGFGLPVLEAMACGTPVICSQTPSLLEVAGQATLTFPADNVDALIAALKLVSSSPALRSELRTKGLTQAQRFSWAQCAQTTLDVYTHAATL